MPVLPQNPQRVEAVPSPTREGYSTAGTSAGAERRSTKTVAAAVVAAIAIVAALVAVLAALGVGPFQGGSASPNVNESSAEATSGSVATNEGGDSGNTNTSSNNANASTNANSPTGSNANASNANTASDAGQNASSDNGNASSSSNGNASEVSNAANDTGSDDASSGSVSLSNGYVSNSNSAYGYSLRVPSTFTLAGSDSAGNATLTDTASPCVITVSVDNNPNGYTVDQALANASAGASPSAYTAEGSGWYVISDEPNGSVYYVMSYVQQGRTISMRFSYPTSAKSQCDPIIESVQPTFSVN